MKRQKNRYYGKERRRYPRLRGTLVEYSLIEKIDSKKTSFTENISPVGICFLVDEKIKADTLLSLRIYLPGREYPIGAKGKAVWTEESSFLTSAKKGHYDLGVEFIEIEEVDQLRICEYVLRHIKKTQNSNGD